MASRPRRSCAKGDTSVLSPSSIFLWSDTRLRQELTRRGLSKTGIRQDLIDRLLDDINGVISKSAGSADGNGPAENQFLTPKQEVEDEPDPPEQQNSVAAVETPKERRPRTKKQKLNISENTKPQFNENSGESGSISTDDKAQESSKQDDETPEHHSLFASLCRSGLRLESLQLVFVRLFLNTKPRDDLADNVKERLLAKMQHSHKNRLPPLGMMANAVLK
ncbi:unnamed protein product [Nippostrongylus brasiliensis]|uniref:SAP domain-containing protein n=1 Tax=Nippostrongylus brasiliensis TaxID=27835 RepID=A0A0N4YV68_NIPBR|nr:unnamed protein product [Nippostrongylus brasiliensis]